MSRWNGGRRGREPEGPKDLPMMIMAIFGTLLLLIAIALVFSE